MTAMAPQFAYILNRKFHPESNVLRIHIQHVMKGSYTLEGSHASRMAQLVTVDMDKYRLVGIPPSGR